MPETGTPDLSALLRKALADDPEVKEIFKQLYPAMSQQFETTAMFLVATLGWATRARLAELADKRAKAERQVWGGGGGRLHAPRAQARRHPRRALCSGRPAHARTANGHLHRRSRGEGGPWHAIGCFLNLTIARPPGTAPSAMPTSA